MHLLLLLLFIALHFVNQVEMNSYERHTLAKIPAKYISYSHTICAYSAFLVALVVGCYTHYDKIVRNEYFGYPQNLMQEWFPSVSATTGDRYPARALFQILIALTAGPRFALVYLWYICTTVSTRSKRLGKMLLTIGIIRTIACGGWVFITSTDDHSIHDVAMVIYLLSYTMYALFEWSLIFYDVAFDAITSSDFEKFELKITHRDKIGLEEKDVA
ncbi:hypothetical protein MFLAVUS_000730 [Mucor flavus]|uniref:CWH43-like N-terminal domain-containing protein n=1 Tax=Mucor flavus TaxID=439312 RepID=A0ABP9YKH8_9FUNG